MTNHIGPHVARVGVFYYVFFALQAVRGIVLIPLLLNILSAPGYGVFVLALTAASYGVVIAQLGLDAALYQYLTPALGTKREGSIYWSAILAAAAWTGVVIALGAGAASFFPSLSPFLTWGTAGAVAGQVLWGLALAPLRCRERVFTFLCLTNVVMAGDLVLTLAAAAWFRNVEAVILSIGAFHAATALLFQSARMRATPFASVSFDEARRLVSFGVRGVVNQLMLAGYFVFDRTLISLAAGVAAVAAYTPGMALGAVMLPMANMASATLPTLLARGEARHSATLKRAIIHAALRQYALIAVPACAGIALVAGPFFTLVAPAEIAATATRVAILAAAAMFASGLGRFAVLALRVEGGDPWLMRSVAAHFAAFLVLATLVCVVFTAHAAIGMAAAILAVNIAQTIAVYRRLARHGRGLVAPALFVTPAVGAAAFSIPLSAVPPHDALQLGLFVAAAIVLYGVTVMALERMGPRALWRLLRTPAALPNAQAPEAAKPEDARPSALLCSGPNHLFVSIGAFYAAELAETCRVTVLLHEYGRAAITDRVMAALHKRDIRIRWIPDRRRLAKHRTNQELVTHVIEETRPALALLDDDMGEFNIVLAEAAKEHGARVVCFQTGAAGENFRDGYLYAVDVLGPALAARHGLPRFLGRWRMIAISHLKHHWHYHAGPFLAAGRMYRGASSLFLRTGAPCQRDGEAWLVYEPGAPEIYRAWGTPPSRVIPVHHPLRRPAGRAMFDDIAPDVVAEESPAAVVLFDLPLEPAGDADQNHAAQAVAAAGALAQELSRFHGRILVKPHPALAGMPELLERLADAMRPYPGTVLLEPRIDGVALLSNAALLIGETSNVLKIARYFSGVTVVSAAYSRTPRELFHASAAGMHVFPTVYDAIAAGLSELRPLAGDAAPEGAVEEGLAETLRRCGAAI